MRKGQYKDRTPESLLAQSATTPGGCREWDGFRDRDGYGRIRFRGKSSCAVSRVIWELLNGPIPDGLHVLHQCDNPPCINPDHLMLGTHEENMADKVKKGRSAKSAGRRYAAEAYSGRRGTKRPTSKLTEEQVRAIRADDSIGRKIAANYNISLSLVGQIKRREAWAWL